MLRSYMAKKIICIASILCVLTAVSLFNTMPAMADGNAKQDIMPKNGVTTGAGLAESVINGRKYKLKKGAKVIVCGKYGDRYVIKVNNKISLFTADEIKILPADGEDASMKSTADKTSLSSILWPTLEDVLRSTVVSEITKHLGQPYIWGATGPDAFDCSGLTRYVYKVALGYRIPRVSYRQQYIDKQITLDEALPGDLLFFKYGRRGDLHGVSHTGMFIGDMQMINAKGKAYGVVVSTLGKEAGQAWPVKVISPIKAILKRYPPITSPPSTATK
jgi:hypothetical protein